MTGNLTHLTSHELTEVFRRGEATPTKVAEAYLARIERHDDGLGAYLTVTRDAALAAARAAEGRYRRRKPRSVAITHTPCRDTTGRCCSRRSR